jgi:hypothetical protein
MKVDKVPGTLLATSCERLGIELEARGHSVLLFWERSSVHNPVHMTVPLLVENAT